MKRMTVEDKLGKTKFTVDESHSHITVDRDYRLNITFFVTAEAFRQQVSQMEPQVHITEAERCVTMQAI